MLCDRVTTKITTGQAGFIQFVVTPVFISLSNISPDIKDVQLAHGIKNIEKWKIRGESE